ncbi:hypothetical protein V5E97_39700 [Singulisphaera sp. Ch08]|uniref:Yip1 domain-containing protein n=1 Tax=Singulisphaera sp. Ch08 TaxID=3120278 RepID=A0AAU7CGN0_9BACT
MLKINLTAKEKANLTTCRRFGLGDMLILVAGTAISLALSRILFPLFRASLSSVPFDKFSGLSDLWDYLSTRPEVALAPVFFASFGLIVLNLVGSLAFVLMRLRKPRPPMGHVLLQPGMVAVEAMLAGLVIGVGFVVLDVAAVFGMLALSSAVLVAWTALALIGRWRPEHGWIDRFGRALGVCWCLLIPVYLVLVVVFW